MDADKPYSAKPIIYAQLYPKLREIAMKHGYSLALHGSLQRDMDLIAFPWADPGKVSPQSEMIEAMRDAIGGYILDDDEPYVGQKPHLRKCWAIHIGVNNHSKSMYLDISVFPGVNEWDISIKEAGRCLCGACGQVLPEYKKPPAA